MLPQVAKHKVPKATVFIAVNLFEILDMVGFNLIN